jgi:hypothetical protein
MGQLSETRINDRKKGTSELFMTSILIKARSIIFRHPLLERAARILCVPAGWTMFMVYWFLPHKIRLRFVAWFDRFSVNNELLYAMRMPPEDKKQPFGDEILPDPEAEAAVLYSGGSDSTLTASYMLENFKRVHLLTYHSSVISNPENAGFNVKNLGMKYGKENIVHRIMDINPIFKKIYLNSLSEDVFRYGLLALGACAPCKFSMHIRTIQYCLQNGVKYISDGSNSFFGMMVANEMIEVLKKLKAFYRSFGLNFIVNPYYSGTEADNELFRKGIVDRPGLRSEFFHYRKTQAKCPMGMYFIVAGKTYYVARHGVKKLKQASLKYYLDKEPFYKEIIEQSLSA